MAARESAAMVKARKMVTEQGITPYAAAQKVGLTRFAIPGVDYPKCFDSREEWEGWKQSARTCGEPCNICHDCTHAYRYEMEQVGRCDRKAWWGFDPKQRRQTDE